MKTVKSTVKSTVFLQYSYLTENKIKKSWKAFLPSAEVDLNRRSVSRVVSSMISAAGAFLSPRDTDTTIFLRNLCFLKN